MTSALCTMGMTCFSCGGPLGNIYIVGVQEVDNEEIMAILIGPLTVAAITGISAGILLSVVLIILCSFCVRLKIHKKCTKWLRKHLPLSTKYEDFDDVPDITAGDTPEDLHQNLQQLENVLNESSTASAESRDKDKDFSENPCMVQFSLFYDYHENRLYINIICALNVPTRWYGRNLKTQVRFQLLPDIDNIFHTEIQTGGKQPIFNETFEFIGYSTRDLMDVTMRLGIYTYDRFSRGKLLGYVSVPFEDIDWDPDEMTILWRSVGIPVVRERTASFLKGRVLHLSLRYQAHSNRISVIVLKGTNLGKPSKIKITAPYICVMLSKDGKILDTRQTKRKRSTNPTWNKAFLFDVDSTRIQQYAITVRVMNYDLLLSDEWIGEVVISPHSDGSGREHWEEMMKRKNINRETAMCHQLT